MKICVIMDNLDLSLGGGVGSFVFDLCYELSGYKDNQIYLIGIVKIRDPNDMMLECLKRKQINIYDLGLKSRKSALLHIAKNVVKLRKFIKEISEGEDVICNLHLKLGTLYGALAAAGLKHAKCVETYHSLYSKYWLENKILSPFINKYIPCSKSAGEEFVRRFHPKSEKVRVIPNGVNVEKIRKCVPQKRPSPSEGQMIALSVGRFTDQKNFSVTAKAFSQIKNKSFVYKIYGQGELRNEILEASDKSAHIILCNPIQREKILNELYNAAIVVIPSLWEGLSIFMLEAIALECPMMISDVASLRDVFNERPLAAEEIWRRCEWGYLVDTCNVRAYKEAMIDYLENPWLFWKMKNAMSQYSGIFDIKNTADQYMRIYRQLV